MFEIIPNWHPIFVHYTVALFSLSVGLFVLSPYVKPSLREQWLIVARWTLWFGAGLTILTGLTGLYAYNTVAHDTPSHVAMTDHRNWAIATMSSFLFLAVLSIIRIRRRQTLGIVFVVLMVMAGSLLTATAWRGGELVYRYGLGVMSLPESEGEGHAHEHADGEGHGHGDSLSADNDKADVHPHDAIGGHDDMSMDDMDIGGMNDSHDDGPAHDH